MRKRIRRTRQFRDDLIDIYGYIHRRSPAAAERLFDAIEKSVKQLAAMPGAGRLWFSSDKRLEGMRVTVITPYRNYLVFFRDAGDAIEVFRVIHGARELEQIVDEIQLDFQDE
jgi:toxin ParE1/3/4